MKNKKTEHPFFCNKKNCRKTAWDTPEYLSEDDWKAIEGFVNIALTMNADKAFEFIWSLTDTKSFFYIVLGWPEGLNYCQSSSYWANSAFPGIVKHTLDKLQNALNLHNSSK